MYVPIYKRKPNRFIRYNERAFNDRSGHFGVEKVAVFFDKNGSKKEMIAFVKWGSSPEAQP